MHDPSLAYTKSFRSQVHAELLQITKVNTNHTRNKIAFMETLRLPISRQKPTCQLTIGFFLPNANDLN